MSQDDYDGRAYATLEEELKNRDYKVSIISKSFAGRHNDDTQGVVEWFFNQYIALLMNSFERKFNS